MVLEFPLIVFSSQKVIRSLRRYSIPTDSDQGCTLFDASAFTSLL